MDSRNISKPDNRDGSGKEPAKTRHLAHDPGSVAFFAVLIISAIYIASLILFAILFGGKGEYSDFLGIYSIPLVIAILIGVFIWLSRGTGILLACGGLLYFGAKALLCFRNGTAFALESTADLSIAVGTGICIVAAIVGIALNTCDW